MSARLLGASGLVLALVLLFAVNIFSGAAFTSARVDLTENGLYTLSQGTRATLRKLSEPVSLRFYLSRDLITQVPGLSGYATRVRELLEEYRRVADGKITLQIVDPEPFSEEEDRAVGHGLRGLPMNEGGDAIYFGLVASNSVDDEDVISYFAPSREQFLEYDLTKLIYALANPQRDVVGLLSTLQMSGAQAQFQTPGTMTPPWAVIEQIQQLFEVRDLDPQVPIPGDIDVLMLVHPQHFPPSTLYAIDQYVLGGGRALVFADPHAESQPISALGGVSEPDRRSHLGPLLAAWGVELEADKVVGDLSLAATVSMEKKGRMVTFQYPVWMNAQPASFRSEDIVTGQLGNITFATAGVLHPIVGASTEFVALIQTSDNAKRFSSRMMSVLSDPEDLLREYRAEGEQFTLVARLSGPASSAYPDGPPAVEPTSESEPAETEPHRSASEVDINIIVVADSDLLHDRFWVQVQNLLGTRLMLPTAANGTLVVNALDNLTGSGDLISVRSRGNFLRPFDRINELRREAELRFREKEIELIERLQEAESRLVDLESRKQGSESIILSQAQQQEVTRFRAERLRIRGELRDVRRELRRNIEALQAWLKFANIALVPLLIGATGLLAGLWQLRRGRPVPAR